MKITGAQEQLKQTTVPLTKQATTVDIPFTATQTADDNQLVFDFSGQAGKISLDDVELIDVTPVPVDPSPLKNGSFANGLTSWSSYVHYDAQAAIEAVNEAARIQIGAEGQEPWSVLLEQGNLSLAKGKTYELSFTASSTVPRPIEVTIENASYTRYFSQVEPITATPKTYSYTFTMDKRYRCVEVLDGTRGRFAVRRP